MEELLPAAGGADWGTRGRTCTALAESSNPRAEGWNWMIFRSFPTQTSLGFDGSTWTAEHSWSTAQLGSFYQLWTVGFLFPPCHPHGERNPHRGNWLTTERLKETLGNKLNLKVLHETYCVAFPSCSSDWCSPTVGSGSASLGGSEPERDSHKLSADSGGFGDMPSEDPFCLREDTPLKTCQTVKGCPCFKYNGKNYQPPIVFLKAKRQTLRFNIFWSRLWHDTEFSAGRIPLISGLLRRLVKE